MERLINKKRGYPRRSLSLKGKGRKGDDDIPLFRKGGGPQKKKGGLYSLFKSMLGGEKIISFIGEKKGGTIFP